MKQLANKIIRPVFGALYGIVMRLVFERVHFSMGDLFSITFVFIVPIIMGITPVLFATKEQLNSKLYTIITPLTTVFLFFIFCFLMRIEDLACIIIIAMPYMLGAALGGFILALIVKRYKKNKGILYSVFFIPFITGIFEDKLTTAEESYQVNTSVIINASPKKVWMNVVRVNNIRDHEFKKGFFNYAGIPRPVYAELNKDTLGATRKGHFEGGLIFKETVTQWKKDTAVTFDIKAIPSAKNNTILERHILKGNHFKFLNATYTLKLINKNQTELTLSSSYQLDTKINFYGSYWGNILLTDFQSRLLDVIKRRCDE